ncbi:hypothetical protein RF11_11708 [Thelohanellus kitauei]|uniref:Uncharacterized protein n=1 Tax=Thelohanellus kitauei TaxID=669202 RepID=A0A0C2MZL1_THEKT|nr:hypothetical protein RF11_11708 [Thelohanellus kitauei]
MRNRNFVLEYLKPIFIKTGFNQKASQDNVFAIEEEWVFKINNNIGIVPAFLCRQNLSVNHLSGHQYSSNRMLLILSNKQFLLTLLREMLQTCILWQSMNMISGWQSKSLVFKHYSPNKSIYYSFGRQDEIL